MPIPVAVRLTAVHLGCDLCGETVRIAVDGHLPLDEALEPAHVWVASHLRPRVVRSEVAKTWLFPPLPGSTVGDGSLERDE